VVTVPDWDVMVSHAESVVSVAAGDGGALLRVAGELDLGNAEQVRADLHAAIDSRAHRPLRLDLAQLTFIDARGLAVLLDAAAHARRRRVPLSLLNVPDPVRRIIDVTGTGAALGVPRPD
jgi:anti-anti-sigma factor